MECPEKKMSYQQPDTKQKQTAVDDKHYESCEEQPKNNGLWHQQNLYRVGMKASQSTVWKILFESRNIETIQQDINHSYSNQALLLSSKNWKARLEFAKKKKKWLTRVLRLSWLYAHQSNMVDIVMACDLWLY